MQVARHVQSTKNRKLVIFLQYLKKKDIDEVYFLQADKHESFLQVDTIILVCLAEQNFACAVKFFSVATVLSFSFDAKHSVILQGPSHVCCYLLRI